MAIVFGIYEYNIYLFVLYPLPSHSTSGLDKKAGEGDGEGMKKKKERATLSPCRVLFSAVFPLREENITIIERVRRRPIFGKQKRRKEGDKGGQVR